MVEFIKKNVWILLLVIYVISFFWKFFVQGLLPIPADTIVGLYHPFLDLYAKVSPQGVPFYNFLITDPVRQIIPWKILVIDSLTSFSLPLWNPYEMAGKPLLANFQSATFYPFNLLLFIKPFAYSWSIFILIQPLLVGVFMFFYLKYHKLDGRAVLFGSGSFALSGFTIAWLEWGNIIHTAMWLPLILLSIDKLVLSSKYKVLSILKNGWLWVLLVSFTFSFFAGHLQVFFYLYILSAAYFIFRLFGEKNKLNIALSYLILNTLFLILTFVQWYPTLQFINLSGRSLDVTGEYLKSGWFIPPQHLVQFLAPDFFGNPATLNYWGVWNYGEFVGYVGVIALFFAFLALFVKKTKEILFFLGVLITSLLFALPNVISTLPFKFALPFISTSQPTRLIFPITFALCVLAAYGLNSLIKEKISKRVLIFTSTLILIVFALLWGVVLARVDLSISADNLLVAKRNLILPSIVALVGLLAVWAYKITKEELTRDFLILAIIALSFFDLFRFGSKFTPFTNPEYFFPKTRVIEFLQKDKSIFRIATTDSRILAPNIATYYKISSIEGYDPLYLNSYAQLIASSERNDHSITPPFGFNRIITPRNISSPIINLLNVKYVLSFDDLPKDQFVKVFSEGQTKVYQNLKVIPRAFFVEKTLPAGSAQKDIDKLFTIDLKKEAVVSIVGKNGIYSSGSALISEYQPNKITVQTKNKGNGFLVLTDTYYPTWEAYVDGRKTYIYTANHTFRGIVVPSGTHTVEFINTFTLL